MELILQALIYAYTITHFEPIGWFMDVILEKTNNNLFILLLNELLRCMKCASMWLTLLLTGNILYACIAFIIAFIYTKNFSAWEKRIKF